ncbi:hypothetical protein [Leifsonia aquatica]|uniref:hypothetical protein n=1 Tax=Leifsonia aquatica TaxID=144185 RepID=UPI0004688407|nr:hypothetical protein [Leifsonia aquatica]
MSNAVPVLPLACHPYPVPPIVVQAIKEAKEYLCARDGLQFKVQISEGVQANPTRVLALNGPPPFLCDAAKVRNWRDKEELAFWIEWVLDEARPVEEGFTQVEWLGQYLPGIRDITDEVNGWDLMVQTETFLEKERERERRGVGFR